VRHVRRSLFTRIREVQPLFNGDSSFSPRTAQVNGSRRYRAALSVVSLTHDTPSHRAAATHPPPPRPPDTKGRERKYDPIIRNTFRVSERSETAAS
jgi:hypothetical protein